MSPDQLTTSSLGEGRRICSGNCLSPVLAKLSGKHSPARSMYMGASVVGPWALKTLQCEVLQVTLGVTRMLFPCLCVGLPSAV